jgi:hypothetical protein
MVVLGGHTFLPYTDRRDREGYRQDSEIDWLDYGACAGPGDSLYWGPDDEITEITETTRDKPDGGMEHASEATDTAQKVLGFSYEFLDYYSDLPQGEINTPQDKLWLLQMPLSPATMQRTTITMRALDIILKALANVETASGGSIDPTETIFHNPHVQI